MDAGRMVDLASKWKTLPNQHICQSIIMVPNMEIPDAVGSPARVSVHNDGCSGTLNTVRSV